MKQINVTTQELEAAMQRADAIFDESEWQARCIEIALIPQVYRRLKLLNKKVAPKITRVKGKSTKGMTVEDNRAVTDWRVYAGYVLTLYDGVTHWNSSERADYYSHAPSVCFNGMGRELYRVQFIHDLRMIAELVRQGKDYNDWYPYLARVHEAGIEVVQ